MTPAQAKKMTTGCDPVAWLAVADYLDEQGKDAEPWRTRGLVGVALTAWFDAYHNPTTDFSEPYKPLRSHIGVTPDYYLAVLRAKKGLSFRLWTRDLAANSLKRFSVGFYHEEKGLRALIFRVSAEILMHRRFKDEMSDYCKGEGEP